MAGVRSADPFAAMTKTVQLQNNRFQIEGRTYDLALLGKVVAAGCGKAVAPMALALETLFGDRLSSGIVVAKHGHRLPLKKIALIEAAHPIPDHAGLEAAYQTIDLARSLGERDLLFCLLSGGGSALLPCPAENLTLADKQRTTEVLLKSGADIKEINAVRKHLSRLKGGRLAKLAAPAQVIALVLSDVVNDSLEAIASGPTAPDSSTYADCLRIMQRYDAGHEIPTAVMDLLARGAKGESKETPKASDPVFQRVHNVVIGSNRLAQVAARQRAEALGYHPLLAANAIDGESCVLAKSHAARIKGMIRQRSTARPICMIAGGETTVTVRGDGSGGRNQEFVLAAAIEIDGLDGVVVLSGGTDGTDGPTEAAGGIVDGGTIARAKVNRLDAAASLARNDSYHFLRATGDLMITGPTLTNVMDLQITLLA